MKTKIPSPIAGGDPHSVVLFAADGSWKKKGLAPMEKDDRKLMGPRFTWRPDAETENKKAEGDS